MLLELVFGANLNDLDAASFKLSIVDVTVRFLSDDFVGLALRGRAKVPWFSTLKSVSRFSKILSFS